MSNYKIIIDEKYMYLVVNNNKELHYTEYNQELKEILEESFSTAHIRYDGRIRLEKVVNRERYYYLWYHIVYCFHHRGLSKENVHHTLQTFSKEIESQNMVIDHLDNNKENNCKCNLSLVARSDNSSKMNTNKKFKNMFHIAKAFDGEKYRVLFTYITKNRQPKIKSLLYMCNNMEDLNVLCKYLKKEKWSIRNKNIGTEDFKELFKLKEITLSAPMFSSLTLLLPLIDSADIQKTLNLLAIDKLTIYNVSKTERSFFNF